MDVSTLIPDAQALKGYAHVFVWVVLAMGVLEAAGSTFGPLVRERWPQTYRWLAATWSFLREVFNKLPTPRAPAPATDAPRANDGFATRGTLLAIITALSVLGTVSALASGCSGSQVRKEAITADATSRAFNRAQPIVLAEYENTGRAEIHAACCDRAAMDAALAAHDARWQPVVAGWELARLAHDAWRSELTTCQQTPTQQCTQSTEHLATVFLTTLGQARCALHAIGRADLDPLTALGAAPCASQDGGI
jgi:hypothetical protein